jgi:Kef-type K+ transport system membrane component KefB
MHQEIFSLIWIAVGVLIIPLFVPLLRLPVAVGELLFGLLLYFIFNKLQLEPAFWNIFDFLSFLGFSVLMFLAGLEIDWDKLEGLTKKEKTVISLVLITNLLLGFIAVKLISLSPEYFLLLSAFGIGLMVTVLREINISEHVKQIILITGSLGEILTLLLLTFYDLYKTFGLTKQFYLHLLIIAVAVVVFFMVLRLLRLLIWFYPEKFTYLIESEGKAVLDVRASIALMFTFMVISSLIHMEPILGAFIAGTLFGFIFREKRTIEERISALGYGFLIPFFFIGVGITTDVPKLQNISLWKEVLIFTSLLVGIKFLSLLWLKLLNFNLKRIVLSTLLFSFPFTIFIAVAQIFLQKGIWNDEQFTFAVALTLFTAVVFPLLVKTFFKG